MPERFKVTKMTLRPIRTKREHQAALREIEALWEAPSGSPKADRLEVWAPVRSCLKLADLKLLMDFDRRVRVRVAIEA